MCSCVTALPDARYVESLSRSSSLLVTMFHQRRYQRRRKLVRGRVNHAIEPEPAVSTSRFAGLKNGV